MTRVVFKLEFPIVVILDNIWHVRRTPDREESVSLKLKYYTGFSLNSQENTKMGGGVVPYLNDSDRLDLRGFKKLAGLWRTDQS